MTNVILRETLAQLAALGGPFKTTARLIGAPPKQG